ncbi:MAG TPA: hypothetical protein VK745_08745 [Polyangiaceae bacterium]|jgi:hypothetical protein|nr:hypothetical protein [Polyangiaceae bacterium]
MRRLRLQILALLAVVAVLVSSGAAASTHYLCRMTGRVVATCCCASEGSSRATHAPQQARPADCCEKIVTAARAGMTSTRAWFDGISGPSLVATLPPYGYAPLNAQIVGMPVRSARAPPAGRPALFIVHCAFLI